MRRIFTLFFSLGFMGLTQQVFSQTCAVDASCSATTEDFSDNASGFTSSGTPSFSYNSAAGRFDAQLDRSQSASITSISFTPGGTTVSIKGEFTAAQPGNVTVVLTDASGNTVLTTCTPTTAVAGGTTVAVCQTFSGLTGGTTYRVRFTFTRTSGGANNPQLISFDNFGIDPSNTVLPVNFTGLAARKTGTSTQLSWSVGPEQNVSGYDIQRSTNGQTFSKIGSVKASSQSSYSFVDAQSSKGTTYYRIKSVDADGKFKYSAVIRFSNGKLSLVLKAYPMPARNQVTVQHSAAVTSGKMTITSEDGRLVRSIKPTPGSLETIVDLMNLKAGLYLLRFDNGDGDSQVLKLVKQ